MNKTILILGFSLLIFASAVVGQNLPNGGFEIWEQIDLFEQPVLWNTGNMQSYSVGSTAIKSEDSFNGNYALRLETIITEEDTLFGYAFSNGQVSGEGVENLEFTGGFPVTAAPDSFIIHLKYSVAENDTALILVMFKNDGVVIGENWISIFGESTEYKRKSYGLADMGETPDTALIAFACSHPDKPLPGGWMMVDSLGFYGTDDTIPNSDFEYWENFSFEDPQSWTTGNLFATLFGGDISATQTEDAIQGDYALRLESVNVSMPAEEGLENRIIGFVLPYMDINDIIDDQMPRFEINFNPMNLTGYYKFDPVLNDTALIWTLLTDEEESEYNYSVFLTESEVYTEFQIPFDYPAETVITGITIFVFTSNITFDEEGNGEPGTVLYLDGLELASPCDTFPEYHIANIIYPDCGGPAINAGEGWDEYLWSTEETTQQIIAEEVGYYYVTVTDSATRCEFTDIVTVEFEPCVRVQQYINHEPVIEVYPNPNPGQFTVDLKNMSSPGYTLQIISITGRTVIDETYKLSRSSAKLNVNMDRFSPGIYLIKVNSGDYSYLDRIVVY
ncbi:MAG: T9SS type A sorting domain-containing protein [Bacteroidales bacterium]|nr:T9SS type A sorting domain-containing protein [Bacteroidales bacterium]